LKATKITDPRSPAYPVREMSTGMPATLQLGTLKYVSLEIPAWDTVFIRRPDVGPWSASAATFSEMSSIRTSIFRPFWQNQRKLGSAAVQRYLFSSRRVMVPSSITLPCSSHQQQ